MKVVNNHLTMTVSTGTVTGQGDLTGQPWNWTFLRAEFKMTTKTYSMRIVDYNFLADPNSIMGHKEFFLTLNSTPGQKLFQQEDVALHMVDQATYATEHAKLLGH